MPLDRLTIEDFSDREFMLAVVDAYDDDGWADSLHVAQRLDLASRRLASSRLSWLARYGAVEREHRRDESGNMRYHKSGKVMYTQRWRLTQLGSDVAYGKLRKKDDTALVGLGDGQMLLVTRWLSERTRDDAGIGKLVQREWKFGHARRNGYHR